MVPNLRELMVHIEDLPLPDFIKAVRNIGQMHAAEKLDGCLDGSTVLETLEFGDKTIQEIVDANLECHVKGLAHDRNEVVFSRVLNFSAQENSNKQWFEVELESGQKLKITGNHRVWLPELECYRRIDDLNGDEMICFD